MSKFSMFYLFVAIFIVGFYGYSTAFGKEPLTTPSREKSTRDARNGGYRGGTFIFIHSGGFRGK